MNNILRKEKDMDSVEILKKQMQMIEYLAFTLNFVEENTTLTKSAINAFRNSFECFNIKYVGNGEYIKEYEYEDDIASYVFYKANLISEW